MNKYDGLLSEIAHRYHIKKGTHETETEWKTRLVYSICGMMAYASLWDNLDEGPISILHLKKKVRSILLSYMALYPELSDSLPYDPEELETEVTDQFISAGVVYHRTNRVAPSVKREVLFDNILFQRGIALDDISCVSGIGFYSKQNGSASLDGVKAMFGLEHEKLHDLWSVTLSSASWKADLLFEQGTEYLRLKPPFSQGYWINKPDKTGIVSILRTGTNGSQLYYLYRCLGTVMEVSPLPQWRVRSYNYRSLACACLLSYGSLPRIKYFKDGNLIHIRLNYLLPPRELVFLKLYSWPETCITFPCDFNRRLSAEVFEAIKCILSDEGYQFEGGII